MFSWNEMECINEGEFNYYLFTREDFKNNERLLSRNSLLNWIGIQDMTSKILWNSDKAPPVGVRLF